MGSTDVAYISVWIGLAGLAGYIAHRKGRPWKDAAFLALVVPPVGVLAALLMSPAPESGQPANSAARVLVGLAPLWIAIAAMLIGGQVYRSSGYWNAAPWLIVAAIPLCVLTLAAVELSARRRH